RPCEVRRVRRVRRARHVAGCRRHDHEMRQTADWIEPDERHRVERERRIHRTDSRTVSVLEREAPRLERLRALTVPEAHQARILMAPVRSRWIVRANVSELFEIDLESRCAIDRRIRIAESR